MVKRLRHGPFTAVTWVRFPYGSYKKVLQLRLKGFFYASRTESNRAADCRKVPSSRHVRMDGTHTGKFAAESVQAALRRVRGSAANFVPRGSGGEAHPVDETASRRGRSAPIFASARAPRKSAKRERSRWKEFLTRVCGQKWAPPKVSRACDPLKSSAAHAAGPVAL